MITCHRNSLLLSAVLVCSALAAPSQVKIVARDGRFELLRNGQPYFVKGAVGAVHLEELAAAGGNSIRAGAGALDRAQSLGLTVLLNLPFGKQRTGFDYSDPARVQAQRDEIRQIVAKHKDHPALLAWAVGNELEIFTTPEQRAVLWTELNQVAKMIHEIDPAHPVITPIGDAYRKILHELNRYAPDLDAVGLNAYSDMLTLPEDVASQGWARPYLVTEFGPRGHWQVPRTAWKLPIEDTSTEKAAFYRKAYNHAVAGRPNCLGAYVFHWAQHHEKTHTWYGMFLEDGSRTESIEVMTYLWTGKWPANRSPRIGPSAITIEGYVPGPVTLPPDAAFRCRIDVSDPDRDALRITWELRKDVSGNRNVGGDREEPTPPLEGAIVEAAGSSATIRLPAGEGVYRLFVYAHDGHGNAATANVPILAAARKYPAPPPAAARSGAGIQRTMALLASSTPDHRNPVRILFYGQSITKQEWSQLVAQDLRQRFPYADLTILNRAIGGYSSDYLVRTLPHDVYAFYPDLVIFHDYGGEENYAKIIAGIRQHTTAEILIQSDYPTWAPTEGKPSDPARVKGEAFHDRHSFEWLPELCRRHGCEVVDVRRPWQWYLRANGLAPGDLLSDGTHLNEEGNHLLAAITRWYLRYDPELPYQNRVREYETGRDIDWVDGRLRLEFEGNRVDVIAARGSAFHAAEADVRIDGRRPSEIPELYSITRPSDTFVVDWPAVNRVSADKPLLIEDWTLRVLETNPDDSQWRFEVTGSRTGPDGAGVSSERFVSKSGRVVLEPSDWAFKRAFDYRHVPTPAGFIVNWSVRPMFLDTYLPPRIEDPSREHAETLALGLANGRHVLELTSRNKTNPPIRAIRVYAPPEP